MLFPIYVSCLFSMLFLSVNCYVTNENSIFGWVSSGVGKIMDFIFTPEQEVAGSDLHMYLVTRDMISSEVKAANPPTNNGQIFFIIHGYMSGINESWCEVLTKRILEKNPDSLVAQVSWEDLASKLYAISKRFAEHIGLRLAQIIVALELDYDVAADRFVLIGHSLGAQISGWAGRFYTKITSKKLRRIVALDPAQPLFKNVEESKRLNANDAEIVVVVHTDSFFGFHPPCGTLDFYVNGGQSQSRCHNLTEWSQQVICDHTSSHEYFIKAVSRPDLYLGKECRTLENCEKGIVSEEGELVSMGDLEQNITGLYYVRTPDNN